MGLVREVAVAWRTVEMADKQRHHTRTGRGNLRGPTSAKPFPGVSAGGAVDKASTAVITCFKCRKPGHLDRNCPLHTFSSKASASPAGGRENGGHGPYTGRGRPPPSAPQQRPQQQRQPQQRQPQLSQQQQRFSALHPGSTPFSGAGKGHGGASSTAFHRRYVGGCAVFSGDTKPAGAGRATDFLPPHPVPSSANAPASGNAPAADGPGESGPCVPAFRGVLPGSMSGFCAEGVAVDEREKWCQASLSVPEAAVIAAVDAVAILDSGSGITIMSAGIANKLQAEFPDVQVVGGMAHPGKFKVADGRVLVVQERTCPVRIALHTSWGLVTMEPFSFAVMPGDDDVVILGNPTLKLLGIDV